MPCAFVPKKPNWSANTSRKGAHWPPTRKQPPHFDDLENSVLNCSWEKVSNPRKSTRCPSSCVITNLPDELCSWERLTIRKYPLPGSKPAQDVWAPQFGAELVRTRTVIAPPITSTILRPIAGSRSTALT